MEYRIGAGQAQSTADRFAALLQSEPRRFQGLLCQFRLLCQQLRCQVRQIAGAALFEQLAAQGLLETTQGTEYGGDVHPEQFGGSRQGAATNQGEYQGEVGVVDLVLRHCNPTLLNRQY
ncbi:hypothetical protein D3C85_1436950 [compost metagenome]